MGGMADGGRYRMDGGVADKACNSGANDATKEQRKRGQDRVDAQRPRPQSTGWGHNALTETTSIHTQGVITRLAVACESRG